MRSSWISFTCQESTLLCTDTDRPCNSNETTDTFSHCSPKWCVRTLWLLDHIIKVSLDAGWHDSGLFRISVSTVLCLCAANRQIFSGETHHGSTQSLQFSSSSNRLYCSGSKGVVTSWSLDTRREDPSSSSTSVISSRRRRLPSQNYSQHNRLRSSAVSMTDFSTPHFQRIQCPPLHGIPINSASAIRCSDLKVSLWYCVCVRVCVRFVTLAFDASHNVFIWLTLVLENVIVSATTVFHFPRLIKIRTSIVENALPCFISFQYCVTKGGCFVQPKPRNLRLAIIICSLIYHHSLEGYCMLFLSLHMVWMPFMILNFMNNRWFQSTRNTMWKFD